MDLISYERISSKVEWQDREYTESYHFLTTEYHEDHF